MMVSFYNLLSFGLLRALSFKRDFDSRFIIRCANRFKVSLLVLHFLRVRKMAPVKLEGKSAWKDGFLFVGNHLALDFLNTRPVQNEETQELLLDFAALLRWFLAAELLSLHEVSNLRQSWEKSSRGLRAVEAMREFREHLRMEVLSWEAGGHIHGAMIDKLNRLLVAHPMIATVKQSDTGPQMGLSFEAHQPEDLFAPLAYAATKLFTEADRSRVRKCGQCVLHFLDTSKKGTRRWCSMQLCGNRLKVAAYARRKRYAR
jgi:predicted RNA-binding Zn ribbon-like protein